jgi:iron complex transport system substrate-binding protein
MQPIAFAPQPDLLADHPAARWSGTGRLDGPARRIVSLLPSATEIVCALGLADRLVAVTHECDFPPDVVAGLPRITSSLLPVEVTGQREIDTAVRAAVASGHGLYGIDQQALAELAPDLLLTQELCAVCAVSYPMVLEAARAAGGARRGGELAEPLVVSLEPSGLEDVLATIELVARLAGVEDEGRRVAGDLRARLGSLPRRQRERRGPEREPRRVALLEWLDPVFTPGHWVPEQIEAAGGESVLGVAGERSREAAWDDLAFADPEVVVLGLCGFDLEKSLQAWSKFRAAGLPEGLTRTAAWRRGEVWAIDGSAYTSRPGPRLVDGAEIVANILAGREDPRAVRLT